MFAQDVKQSSSFITGQIMKVMLFASFRESSAAFFFPFVVIPIARYNKFSNVNCCLIAVAITLGIGIVFFFIFYIRIKKYNENKNNTVISKPARHETRKRYHDKIPLHIHHFGFLHARARIRMLVFIHEFACYTLNLLVIKEKLHALTCRL